MPNKEVSQCDAAEGLAWSYYIGYFAIILKSMRLRIQNSAFYQDARSRPNDTVMSTKLIVLLPESCNAPGTLTDVDDRVVHVGQLEELTVDRAGNPKRSYRTNVYDVQTNNKHYYCAVEYATPLLTLFEMAKIPEANLDQEQLRQQGQKFHESLEKILAMMGLLEHVVLLPFKDRKDDGSALPIAEMLAGEIERQAAAEEAGENTPTVVEETVSP